MSNDHLHHKSERSLQVHLAHAQAAFDAITDALIAIDENGTIENANIAAVRIFGYTNEELFGENVSILMPEPDRSHHDEYIANYLRSGKPKVIGIGRELVGQKKDGSLFPMELSVGEAVVGDHKVFTGIVRDITSQRAAESKRDLYGRLVEQSLNEIYTFEVDTLFFTQINEGARRNLGYSLDELKSMTPLDVKSDFTEQSFRSLIAPIVEKEKEKIVFETRHKRKDGSLYDVEVHMQRLENGAKTLIAAFIVDVTERNQIVKQLKAAYSFSSTLLESAAVLIAASDAHQRFTSFNRAAEQLTGYTEAEVLGRNPRDFLIPPEDLEKYDQLVSVGLRKAQSAQNLRPTGGPDTFDWLCKDGSRRTISWWYGSAPDEESTERYWIIATGIDVTGVKALEDQLRQAQKMETLGHLTGGIAHDFNNLLAAIMGSLEIVESEISDQTPIKEFLNDALEATEMAADLTRRLLTFARRQPLEPKITDLNALIRNVQGILRRTLGGNIIMELRLKKDIGLTTVDPVQFENLIMNLCINARDAMPTGGTLTISTDTVVFDADDVASLGDVLAGRYVKVVVADNGEGMTEDVKERAMEPFFTTKTGEDGTGLGLSMAYGFMKQSGGHINLYSEPGKGTVITLYLPVSVNVNEPLVASPKTIPAAPESATVLVVDDNPRVRRVALRQIESLGYSTMEAESGEQALNIITEGQHIDLVLTDVVMPGGISGPELASHLRETGYQGKIILTSGFTKDAINSDELATGHIQLLQKPYSKSTLAAALRNTLEQ